MLLDKLEEIENKYDELTKILSDPEIFSYVISGARISILFITMGFLVMDPSSISTSQSVASFVVVEVNWQAVLVWSSWIAITAVPVPVLQSSARPVAVTLSQKYTFWLVSPLPPHDHSDVSGHRPAADPQGLDSPGIGTGRNRSDFR